MIDIHHLSDHSSLYLQTHPFINPLTYLFRCYDIIFILLASPVLLSPDSLGMGYLQHVVLASGVLWKRVTSGGSGAVGSLLYRKRYFELSNIALTYFPTEKKTGVSSKKYLNSLCYLYC